MQLPDSSAVRVAILAGGISNERLVSLASARQVHEALARAGYTTEIIDTKDAPKAVQRLINGAFDVAFIALHGKGGEDGTVQGLCEILGIPYTGSGVLASALAMDKARSKVVYADHGLPTAASYVVRRGVDYDVQQILAAVGEKCVVKPIGDGSSVGMSIVHRVDELPAAIDKAFDADASGRNDVLIESYIEGIEITVAVLGNDRPEALPVIEIVPHAEFYDYDVKYKVAGADHVIPARLEPAMYAKAQEYAVIAHRALGCRGMSRSDFIVDSQRGPLILETNTIPGMTATSLLPDAARHAGYDFSQLCSLLIAYALEARA